MKKILIGAMIFFAGFASCLILTHGSLQAQGSSDAIIMSKLDEVIRNEQNIMAALNSLKEDIRIVKIRVTQIQ